MMWRPQIAAAVGILFTTSLAGTALYAFSKGKQYGMSQVQTLWTQERLALSEAQAEEVMKARQREEALKVLIARQRQEHRNEIHRIGREHSALVDSLRDRPEARAGDSGVPDGADAGVGCTGRGLSAPDAQFLAGFAADAARLQSALRACQRAYDEVRESINARD